MKKNIFKTVKEYSDQETPQKYLLAAGCILIAVILCEIFIFNFKCIGSLFDKPVQCSPDYVSGAQISNDRISISSDNAVIRFDNIGTELKYIRISPEHNEKALAKIKLTAFDEANSTGLTVPERTVLGLVEPSQYIRLHFSGKVDKLTMNISGMKGYAIEKIELNTRVPMMFSVKRVLILFLILFILYLIRPRSFVYRYKTDLKNRNQQLIAVGLIVVHALMSSAAIKWNTMIIDWNDGLDYHHQYYKLVDAFKNGHLYLEDKPSEELMEMENPYDTYRRVQDDVEFQWDHAYYNGKYYTYFGVVPALAMYLPYNLITGGKDLPNYTVVYILNVMIMVGIMLLLWEVIKKWFKSTPFVLYLLISAVYSFISALSYSIVKPDFYLVPPLMGIMLGLFGLSFWLSAEKAPAVQQKKKNAVPVALCSWRLAAGSALIALIAGCRPQLLIIIAFGFMLFWKAVFKDRLLFSKSGLKQTTALCLPFIIVAVGIMWYNFARFGSPFDFGANYNLTTNDMTHRGIVWGRNGLGLFSYLLQPVNFDSIFPFLHDFGVQSAYQGRTLSENMIGGIYILFPILLAGVYGTFRRKHFGDSRAYRLVYFSVIMTVILVIVDTQMSGLLTRYFTDFIWIAMLASAVTIFAYYHEHKDNETERKRLVTIVTVLVCISFATGFLKIFAHSENSVKRGNPVLYHTVEHAVAFWL